MKNAQDPTDEILPASKLCTLGLQHVLVMYAGAITIPLIIGGAMKLPKDQLAHLISADLFVCGLATLIQTIGFWKVGIRLPIMMGVTFVAVGPMLAIGANPDLGLLGIFGSVIAAGIFTVLFAPFVGRMLPLFPPVVTGTVILTIGLTLMGVAVHWSAGGQPTIPGPDGPIPNPNYALLSNIGIAALVLVSILAIVRYAKGFFANIAVLIGMLVGFAAALMAGRVDISGIGNESWMAFVRPFQFGMPVFDVWAILMMCLVMMVVMIESTGMFLAMGEIVEKPVSEDDLTRAIRADGVGTILGGIFNTFPYTSYSQNIGLVQVTNVRSRWVCVAGGLMMVVLGMLPKLAFVVASIPQYVLGGAALVMFGMVAATGIKILTAVDFSGNRNNLYIVAVSVATGMVPLVSSKFFENFPKELAPLTHSGIVLAALMALALNLVFNGYSRSSRITSRQTALQGVHE